MGSEVTWPLVQSHSVWLVVPHAAPQVLRQQKMIQQLFFEINHSAQLEEI